MRKEKETFEMWTKTKRGSKVGSRANPTDDPGPSKRTSQRRNQKEVVVKPRGMKTTTVRSEEVEAILETELHCEERLDVDDTLKKDQSGRAHENEMSKGKVNTGASVASVKLPGRLQRRGSNQHISEEKEITEMYSPSTGKEWREEVRDCQSDRGRDMGTQRPGKEKAHTPPAHHHSGQQSPRSSESLSLEEERVGTHIHRRTTSKYDTNDRNTRRTRESYDKCRRERSRGSVSRSESESPSRLHKHKRGSHERHEERQGYKKRGQSPNKSKKRVRRLHDSSSEGSEEYVKQQRSDRGYVASPVRRRVSEERDYSHDFHSSSYSEEEEHSKRRRPRLKMNEVKGESMDTETEKRRDRRRRQGQKEAETRKREQQGLKGHYLSVSGRGIPYGFGVGAWRQAINKLSASLDPSVTNIRYQPEEAMATLRHRLKDDFEYGAPVDHAHIRKLAGISVTQRRSRLLKSMEEGDSRPSGMDEEIWKRLDRMRQDPRREELSERMKFANASRVHKGRTGPKGEEGIWEDLYRTLGRDPDPDELQDEMRRKKGYIGIAEKRKETKKLQRNSSANTIEVPGQGKENMDGWNAEAGDKLQSHEVEAGRVTKVYDVTYIRSMEAELKKLRSAMTASKAILEANEDVGPSTSAIGGGQQATHVGCIGNGNPGMTSEVIAEEGDTQNYTNQSTQKQQ